MLYLFYVLFLRCFPTGIKNCNQLICFIKEWCDEIRFHLFVLYNIQFSLFNIHFQCLFPIQDEPSRMTAVHDIESFPEVVYGEPMGNDRADIQSGLESGDHLVPGFEYFPAVYSLNGQPFENHLIHVQGQRFGVNAEHGDFTAVVHIFEHFVKCTRDARQFRQ